MIYEKMEGPGRPGLATEEMHAWHDRRRSTTLLGGRDVLPLTTHN